MADEPLKGLTGAILATEGFGQFELTERRKALDEARARTEVVSPKADRVRGWKFTDWGDEIRVDSQARRYPCLQSRNDPVVQCRRWAASCRLTP